MKKQRIVTLHVIPVTGPEYDVEVPLKNWADKAREIVGGLLQAMPRTELHAKGIKVLADEEGRLKRLGYNLRASEKSGQSVVGTAVVLGKKDMRLWG